MHTSTDKQVYAHMNYPNGSCSYMYLSRVGLYFKFKLKNNMMVKLLEFFARLTD